MGRTRARLFGRDAELAALLARVQDGAPLCTVTGTAGIGKTALAKAFVSHWTDSRAVFCDLAPVRDAGALAEAVARALGVALVLPFESTLAALEPCVLVLDNFEQLTALAETTIERWLEATPELQIVVTSRERLRLPGEVLVELAPLGVAEATQLWHARTDARDPAADVGALLAELDGLPLAIELAAARRAALSASELTGRVAERVGRGLSSALDASWELLSPAERAAFAQLSVFRGAIPPDAAEAVLRTDADPLDLLQALREKSLLVERDGALEMLMSVRRYAKDRLATGPERDAALARHAAWFTEHAELWSRSARTDPAASVRLLDAARSNLMAIVERGDPERALRVLVALDEPHWAQDGSPLSYLAAFDRALGLDLSAVPAPVRVRAHVARARMAWRAGRIETSETDLAQALALARGDLAQEALVLRFSSLVLLLRGKLEGAEAEGRRALDASERAGDPWLVGLAYSVLTFVARMRGDQIAARHSIEQALARFQAVGDLPFVLSLTLESMLVHLDAGEVVLAEQYAARAEALQREHALLPSARYWFGRGHAAMLGDANAALAAERYEAAMHAAQASGETAWEITATICRAVAWVDLGRVAAARVELEEMRRRALPAGSHLYAGLLEALVAVVEGLLGHREEARRLLDRAAALVASPAHQLVVDTCRRHVDGENLHAILQLAKLPGTPLVAEARVLAGVLERTSRTHVSTAARVLRFASDGRWVEPPSSPRVELAKRPVMRRLLDALTLRERLGAPQLIEACWPGERLRRDSAKNRLHVLLTRTRALGFRDLIEGDDRGYVLAADVVVERV